jgi:hypothetical protein
MQVCDQLGIPAARIATSAYQAENWMDPRAGLNAVVKSQAMSSFWTPHKDIYNILLTLG